MMRNKRTSIGVGLAALAVCAALGSASLQPEKKPVPPTPAQPATPGKSVQPVTPPKPAPGKPLSPEEIEQMQKMQQTAAQAAKPGPVHQALAKRAGEYTTATRLWMAPSAPPEESAGTARLTSILGDRFLHEEDTGTMMGQPYSGLRLIGYNNANKQYEATWTYTMGTAMMTMTGASKDDGKTIDWTATFVNDMGIKETLQVVTRFVDDNHFAVRLSGNEPDGTPGPVMETTYTRKKQPPATDPPAHR